ncbi:MAG: 3-phosphoglycerate dehydrogenase [Ruminococcaceae bacterium]|nr:3-phosphoglycerate dehydrogenase [Oscillospiraceae bacterium]
MYSVKLYNKISKQGLELFDEKYSYSEFAENEDAILVRSASLHEIEFSNSLKAIARAGAGTNNIPIDRCTENGICVFNTPGANANGVKELTICSLFLSSRKIVQGINWVHTLEGDISKQVEKGKGAFTGPEISGKTLGVIGAGAIGAKVANDCERLGMNVICYHPAIRPESALKLSPGVEYTNDIDVIYSSCDYITLHVPSKPETKEMICNGSLSKMKDGVRIINLSRGDLVNDDDLLEALNSGKVASYVTDFPSEKLMTAENVIAIPHLGASTPESEDNCAVMAVRQVKDYLENGNVVNSVNYPEVSLRRAGKYRYSIFARTADASYLALKSVSGACAVTAKASSMNKNGEYTIIETDSAIPADICSLIKDTEDIIIFNGFIN